MKKEFFTFILSVLLSFSFNGCLKDKISSPIEKNLNSNVELLSYLESNGNYVNSDNFPSIVEAPEVYDNLGNYLIIDVRSKAEFAAGHIQNAINKIPDSLLIFVKSIQSNNYNKIIIVSSTGQSASYYCCLLNLDGFSNVYSMKYGMASWNVDFSTSWLNNIKDANYIYMDQNINQKADYSQLPEQKYPDQNADIKSKLEFRITQLLSTGFDDDIKSSYSTPVIDFSKLVQKNDSSIYKICLGIPTFYVIVRGPVTHPHNTVNYRYYYPYVEFESSRYLQTVPGYKPVYIYSYAGQVSAFITAYLKVLGYDAYSILYGGNNIIYSAMLAITELSQYAFSSNDINDFPYEVGN